MFKENQEDWLSKTKKPYLDVLSVFGRANDSEKFDQLLVLIVRFFSPYQRPLSRLLPQSPVSRRSFCCNVLCSLPGVGGRDPSCFSVPLRLTCYFSSLPHPHYAWNEVKRGEGAS